MKPGDIYYSSGDSYLLSSTHHPLMLRENIAGHDVVFPALSLKLDEFRVLPGDSTLGDRVRISLMSCDRDDLHRPLRVSTELPLGSVHQHTREEEVAHMVRDALLQAYAHEISEHLMVNGKRLLDPHKREGT